MAPARSDFREYSAPRLDTFGRTLDYFIRRSGISQNTLAKIVSVNASYINRLCSSERNRPTVEVVSSFARALGLSRRETDALLLAAGYRTSYDDDPTIVQLAALLDADQAVAATLRAMVNSAYRVMAAGEAS